MDMVQRPVTSTRHIDFGLAGIVAEFRKRRWLAFVALALVLAIVATSVTIVRVRSAAAVTYVTAPVTQQDLVQSVTATGTVNPQNTVAVGTQESGTVSQVYVDYNSHVKRGQILARLDPTTFQAALDQEQAVLAQTEAQARSAQSTAVGAQSGIGTANASQQAEPATALGALETARSNQAGVATANANVAKAQSALSLAQQTITRDQQLLAQGYIAQSQTDLDRSNLVAAQTTLDSARAAVQQAQLGAAASVNAAQASQAQSSAQNYGIATAQAQAVAQSANAAAMEASVGSVQAQVRQAELNVQKTIIRSPVDGTVVSRAVSVGTTVAASLQTPTLFSIAQDLNKMEVDVSVGEPDIGDVRARESVDFTVLAYPNRTFHGTVSQVRINPVVTTNVVTYTTVVLVDNRDGKLLPGMTANASIDVATASNALIVPLAALAYQPAGGTSSGRHHRSGSAPTSSTSSAASTPDTSATAGTASAYAGSPWGATNGNATAVTTAGSTGRIFVQRSGALVRIPVAVTLVSGARAAVTQRRGSLAAGDAVVTGDSSNDAAATAKHAATAGNPLTGGGGPGRGATRGIQ